MEERLSGILMESSTGGEGENPGKMASRAAKLPLNVIQCGGIGVREPPGGAGARYRALNYGNARTPVCKGCPRGRKDTELENSSIKIFMRLQGFGLSVLLLLPLICASARRRARGTRGRISMIKRTVTNGCCPREAARLWWRDVGQEHVHAPALEGRRQAASWM